MGQPVVHFEIVGKDGEKLRSYYSELFGWEFGDPIGPFRHLVVYPPMIRGIGRAWRERVGDPAPASA